MLIQYSAAWARRHTLRAPVNPTTVWPMNGTVCRKDGSSPSERSVVHASQPSPVSNNNNPTSQNDRRHIQYERKKNVVKLPESE